MQRLDRRWLGPTGWGRDAPIGSGTRLRLARDGFKRCKNQWHGRVSAGGAGPVPDRLLRLLNDSGGGSVPATVLHRHHKVVTAQNRRHRPPTRGPEQYLT